MNKMKRILFILLFSFMLFAGGLTVTVADSSISGILSTWLHNKTEKSIEEIDQTIQEEQAIQTERLKKVLAEQIAEVESEWNEFLEAEKEKQINKLREYTDEKIRHLPEMEPLNNKNLENELEQIYQEAIRKMENVTFEKLEEIEGEE